MSDNNDKNTKGSFWTTIPGCLTGIAALITAVGGLITILFAVGLLKPLSPPTPTPISNSNSANQQNTVSPTALPLIQRQGQFRIEFTNLLTNYDFDAGQTYDDYQNPAADFFFKPDNNQNPQSLIGVDPLHGAKFGGGYLDVLPWDVPQDQFMATIYSVPQNRQVPCITSQGVYCSFTLIIASNGLTIDYAVYNR